MERRELSQGKKHGRRGEEPVEQDVHSDRGLDVVERTSELRDPATDPSSGDETRLSNFLIWQTAYSEYYFTPVLWPDFGKKEIDQALKSYGERHRRFGGL